MKNHILFRFIIFLLLCASGPILAKEKITVAVLDFEAKNVTAQNAEAVSDLLRTELFNTGRFTVVERQKIQKILEEQKFQASGVTDTDKAAQIGRLLNVRKIMIGTVTLLGRTHIINTRILDVQSGLVELAEAVESRGGEESLPQAITELALKISTKVGLEGSIIRITGKVVYVDLGSADGIREGQVLSVIRSGETITDLEGRVIGTNTESIGTLEVVKVNDRFSETSVKKSWQKFRQGDKVRFEDDSEVVKPRPKKTVKKEPEKVRRNPAPDGQNRPDVPPTF